MKHRTAFLALGPALGLLLGLVAWTGCKPSAVEPADDAGGASDSTALIMLTEEQITASGMETGTIRTHTFHAGLDVYGAIQVPPDARAAVHTYFDGYVRQVDVLDGQRVRRGQVLFTLEHPAFLAMQQEYLGARDQLAYLEADYNRQKGLAEDNVASQKTLSRAESEYRVMQGRKEALAGQLRMLGIEPEKLSATTMRTAVAVTAPIDGFAGDLAITRGMFLPADTKALTILNTGAQYAEFYVFEKDLPGIRPEQVIRFHSLNEEEEIFAARIWLIGKQIDPEHKTIPIHARLSNPADAALFSPGMYIEGFIETAVDSAAALPLTAVVETEGKYFALRVEREERGTRWLRQVEVVVGNRDSAFIEIRNAGDFGPGDVFLTRGAFTLIQ